VTDGGPRPRTFTPLYAALTARGVMVLGGALVVLGCGVFLQYAELIGLGVAGVAGVLAALAVVGRTPRVAVSRSVEPARVARGAPGGAVARVTVRAASRRAVPAMSARDLAGSGPVPFPVPRLKGGAVCETAVPLPAGRRGLVPSGPLLVDRDDPFGLAHRTLNTGVASVLYVRPRTVPLPEVAASLARSVDGPQSDTTMEGTLAFNSLREYVPGDELRHVHWRASAHAGKLVVKQHVDTAHAAVAVVLDGIIPAGADAELFDTAADCAASVAAVAATQRHPLRLLDGRGESLLPATVRRGSCSVDDVLDALTTVSASALAADAIDPLADTVRRLAAGARGSLAVVVTTRPADGLADSLRLLAGCYARVAAVRVVDEAASAGGAARTGRVVWVTVREVDELPAVMMRARTAA
jgi:uncharacterized protein (DUF58 family)